MFADVALLLALQSITIPLGHPKVIEQPRAPIETSGPLWASACEGSADRNRPAPPVRIHANSYLVGTCGHSSMLIVGEDGDVLIDGGEDVDADLIAGNIRDLGYSPRDIRFILHTDTGAGELGGIAKLQRLTGAMIIASPAAAKLLRTGTRDDPQPVDVGRVITDGGEVRLGNILLTAFDSSAGLSWRWESCDGGVCRSIVDAGSLTPGDSAAAPPLAASRCEILLTSDPAASDMAKRLVLGQPLFDPDACKTYAARALAEPPAGQPK